MIEVTPAMKTVWEYVVGELVDQPIPLYRTYRVPYEWAPQTAKAQGDGRCAAKAGRL